MTSHENSKTAHVTSRKHVHIQIVQQLKRYVPKNNKITVGNYYFSYDIS